MGIGNKWNSPPVHCRSFSSASSVFSQAVPSETGSYTVMLHGFLLSLFLTEPRHFYPAQVNLWRYWEISSELPWLQHTIESFKVVWSLPFRLIIIFLSPGLLLPWHPNLYCWKFCLQSVLYGNDPQLNKHIPWASQCPPAPTCTND